MASVWIKPRATKKGLRFVVGYRLGGRGSREFHAASLSSRVDAEKLRDAIRMHIAAGRFARRDLSPANGVREERVYFARLGNLIKIGVSVAPERRARNLNAELLRVEPGGREREAELHAAFRHARERGEWFRDDARIRRYLRTPGAVTPEDVSANKERDQSGV